MAKLNKGIEKSRGWRRTDGIAVQRGGIRRSLHGYNSGQNSRRTRETIGGGGDDLLAIQMEGTNQAVMVVVAGQGRFKLMPGKGWLQP